MNEKLVVKFPSNVPEEERQRITKNFENTIDRYFEKMGIERESLEMKDNFTCLFEIYGNDACFNCEQYENCVNAPQIYTLPKEYYKNIPKDDPF